MSLIVSPADRDAVYVLATDPESADVAALMEPKRLNGSAGRTVAGLLGLSELHAAQIELINPEDLENLGLSAYLKDGLGLNEDTVNRDKRNLDALRSPVILLHGRFAEGVERRVELPRGVSYIGRYMPKRLPVGMAPLPTPSAVGVIPPVISPIVDATPANQRWLASLVVGLCLVMVLVALGLVLL